MDADLCPVDLYAVLRTALARRQPNRDRGRAPVTGKGRTKSFWIEQTGPP